MWIFKKSEFLSSIIDILPCGIFIIDSRAIIRACNEEFTKMLCADTDDPLEGDLHMAYFEPFGNVKDSKWDFKEALSAGNLDQAKIYSLIEPRTKNPLSLRLRKIDFGKLGIPITNSFLGPSTNRPERFGFMRGRQNSFYYLALCSEASVIASQNFHRNSSAVKLDKTSFLRKLDRFVVSCGDDSQFSLAVFFLDLDNFKSINDRYGHIAGDDLLQQVDERIGNLTRGDDFLCRYGGDEFVLVTLIDRYKAREIATKIRQRLHGIFDLPFLCGQDQKAINVQASIGFSLCPQDAQDSKALLQFADIAMYKAKKSKANA